jgi:hypothetical protein
MSRARDLGSLINSSAAGKNFVINGGMDIWQRGTSKLDGANSYHTADRWLLSSAPAATFSRQTTNDTTNLPFIQYCMRLQRTAGSTNTNNMNIAQSFESINSVPLAGKTVTLSFYARKGANYSATNSDITAQLFTGTGTDQNAYTVGYTGSVAAISRTAVLTTTWQRFIYTATLAANTNEIGLIFVGTQTGTAGAADFYEITGIQLEQGSSATEFSRAGGDIQGELAKCQRYYETNYPAGITPGFNMPNAGLDFASLSLSAKMGVTGTTGSNRSRSEARVFAVQKRSTPSAIYWDWVGNISKYSGGNFDGSRSSDNLSVDAFGGFGVSDKSISFQTVSASSSIVFAGVMWAASAEL